MGCRWSEVQILSPRPVKSMGYELRFVAHFSYVLFDRVVTSGKVAKGGAARSYVFPLKHDG
jgi:hypothetical protein